MSPPDAQIHVGDTGTALVVRVTDESGAPVNIAAAAALVVFLTAPSGAVLTRTAALDTDGLDGRMTYITQAGDLSAKGTWEIQARVTLGGATWSTRRATFQVFAAPPA